MPEEKQQSSLSDQGGDFQKNHTYTHSYKLQTSEKMKHCLSWEEEVSQGNSGHSVHGIIFTGQLCFHKNTVVVSLKMFK